MNAAMLSEVLKTSFPSKASPSPSLNPSVLLHLKQLVAQELGFLREWFVSLFLERKCPAKGVPISECPECAKRNGEEVFEEEDLEKSKFVQGSTKRVGPHLPEFPEATAAILHRLGKIGQLVQQ